MGDNHALDGWLMRQVEPPSSAEGISVAGRAHFAQTSARR